MAKKNSQEDNSFQLHAYIRQSSKILYLCFPVSLSFSLFLSLSLTYIHTQRPHTCNFLLRNFWAMQEMSVLFSITILNIFLSLSTLNHTHNLLTPHIHHTSHAMLTSYTLTHLTSHSHAMLTAYTILHTQVTHTRHSYITHPHTMLTPHTHALHTHYTHTSHTHTLHTYHSYTVHTS